MREGMAMMTVATHKTDELPADPIHLMLLLHPNKFERAVSRLNKEQNALIRRVFIKSHNSQREVVTIVAELPPHERLEWEVLSNAFSQALDYLRKHGGGE